LYGEEYIHTYISKASIHKNMHRQNYFIMYRLAKKSI